MSDIAGKVKETVLQLEPGADVVLYGSRARHDQRVDSDWDFLVLVDGAVDAARTDRIRHALYEIEWDSGEVISCIVRERREWESSRRSRLPLHKAVDRDGVHV